jgi:hypothetical protein
MSVTGFDAFKLYQALHLHFTDPKYDFFRYGGSVKHCTPERFEIRRDKFYFHRLAKSYPDIEELKFFLAANFFTQKVDWVRDVSSDEAEDMFKRCKRIKDSLEYIVNEDLGKYHYTVPTLQAALVVTDGRYPTLLNQALVHDIHEETVVALNTLVGFLPTWGEKIVDTILFPPIKLRYERYVPFLGINEESFRVSVRKQLTTHK